MRRLGIVPLGVVAIGAALLMPAAAVPSASRTAATPKLPKPKIYDVRITGTHDTTFVNGGCEPYCADGYHGTHSWTQTFRNVRLAFKPWGSSAVMVAPGKLIEGTSAERYDHESTYCKHETPTVMRDANLANFAGIYPAPGQLGQASLQLWGQSIGPEKGDPVACTSRAEEIVFAGRISTSLVSGSTKDGFTRLSFRAGTTKAGPGFPLNRLIAGKSFTISLKGKSIVNQESFKTQKYAYSTTGSVKVVFTPRARSVASVRAPAASTASGCKKTYVSWWSTKKRACFLVSASAAWNETTRWTKDRSGGSCTGSTSTALSWTAAPAPFWVGATFPLGYSGTEKIRTTDFFGSPARGTVNRRVSGGAREFGCVPMLTKDCGRKPIVSERFGPRSAEVIRGQQGVVVVRPESIDLLPTFQACGLVAGDLDYPFDPHWSPGFELARDTYRQGLGGVLMRRVADRLLATPVGRTVVFRGNESYTDPSSQEKRTSGTWAGKLTFKRVS